MATPKKDESKILKQVPIGLSARHREMIDELLTQEAHYTNMSSIMRLALEEFYNKTKTNE